MQKKQIIRRHEKIARITGKSIDRFLLVSIESQKLYLIDKNKILRTFDISTSRFGVGNRSGSNMTPTGVHGIAEKIGAAAPLGRIFKSRRDTGINAQPGLTEDNLILTRIMWLRGLEPGLNKGENIDSYERYIYIHGTNREDLIGKPMSHGCVCMRNADVIELFDAVEEGAIVFIDK
jgi:lipoprotein-anchoring transpeptidase ErfK/SrfK